MYIYGASGHGKVVLEIAESLGKKIEGFIDQNPEIKNIFEYQVNETKPTKGEIILAIGNNLTRKKIAESNPHYTFPILVHPSATVSKRAILQEGTVVMAGVTVNSDTKIGKHCIINTNASIDHDCILGNYVHISPNVALAGNVTIGEGTHVGIGACVIQGITIGANCIVGAGSVVIKDVPDNTVMVGNPGKVIKYT